MDAKTDQPERRGLRLKPWYFLPAAALVPVYVIYRRDKAKAKRRVAAESRIADTSCGPIEYADVGEGPVVLVIHGAGGGFDQGLLVARQNGIDERRYRIIAPSRFGYLRTPMPSDDASPAAQADAHACLLDALGITGPVAVMGVSAGALSAVQFAIKYQGRVSSLVLLVPGGWTPSEAGGAAGHEIGSSNFIMNFVLRQDFLIWSFMKVAKGQLTGFMGVPKELHQQMTPQERKDVEDVMQTILPVSERYRGIMHDVVNARSAERYALEEIRSPTLVIDAEDVITFAASKYTSERIPGAEFLAFETGGHLLVGHGEEVSAAVRDFLARHVTSESRYER